MITVVDYGAGNIQSVLNGLKAVGAAAVVTSDKSVLRESSFIILPGVGAFGPAVDNLTRSGLSGVICQRVLSGVPLLGICLGMQLLFSESEEADGRKGLNLIPGQVVRFTQGCKAPQIKVPHIGWNSVSLCAQSPLLQGIRDGDFFYFAHSYYVRPEGREVITGTAGYGMDFPAVVGKDNIYGIQFHPEKSGRSGLKIFANLKEMVKWS